MVDFISVDHFAVGDTMVSYDTFSVGNSKLNSIVELANCKDWRLWSTYFNVTSAAGGFIMEYFIFIVFSVSRVHLAVIKTV